MMISMLFVVALATTALCDNRIVNGVTVKDMSEAPYQASLQNGNFHYCGGSVISSRYVMSAAHCWSRLLGGHTVNLGSIDNQTPLLRIPMQNWIRHSLYSSSTLDYDYSIIELSSDITFIEGVVEPIRLASKEYPGGTNGIISGWGLMDANHADTPRLMQIADAPLVDLADCQKSWRLQPLTERMQCVGGGTTSGCMGDSGGPVAVYEGSEKVLVGNTSWGSSNCSPDKPAIWSKNVVVLNWITSTTGVSA